MITFIIWLYLFGFVCLFGYQTVTLTMQPQYETRGFEEWTAIILESFVIAYIWPILFVAWFLVLLGVGSDDY